MVWSVKTGPVADPAHGSFSGTILSDFLDQQAHERRHAGDVCRGTLDLIGDVRLVRGAHGEAQRRRTCDRFSRPQHRQHHDQVAPGHQRGADGRLLSW